MPPSIALTIVLSAVALGSGLACSSSPSSPPGDGGKSAVPVVINEVYPNGTSLDDPDWVELKNVGTTSVDLTGFELRDEKLANKAPLPDGTLIAPGAYLVVKCVHPPEGGVVEGLYVPFQLSNGGDEVHLLGLDGVDVDATIFGADVPSDKSWARLPDGTGTFIRATPTKGASNL